LRGSGPEREAAGRKAAQARFTQALAASLTQALARSKGLLFEPVEVRR